MIVSTTYGAVQQMMKFYCDMNPEINLDIIILTFPCSHAKIINQTEELLGQWNEVNPTEGDGQHVPKGKKEGGRVRLVVVDSIASNPGYVLSFFASFLLSFFPSFLLSCLLDQRKWEMGTDR
jgi:hypothetical protein